MGGWGWEQREKGLRIQDQIIEPHLMPPFFRHYNLEIQVNDAIQLNLNEITNLKHDLACTEEKMVYQSYERSRDVWVRDCLTKCMGAMPGIVLGAKNRTLEQVAGG